MTVPAEGKGRAYLVERGLEQDGYPTLLALVSEYIDRANELGIPPMAATPLLWTLVEESSIQLIPGRRT